MTRPTRPAIDILVLGSMWYAGHQLTDQRLTRALGGLGAEIAYVEPAYFPLRRARHQAQGRPQQLGHWQADDGIAVFTPVAIPFSRRPPLAVIAAVWVVLQVLVAHLHRMTRDTTVLVFAAHPTVVAALRPWRRVVVVKDDYVAGTELIGQRSRVVRRRRRVLMNRASQVVVVSSALQQSLLKTGVSATVISAGADVPDTTAPEPAQLGLVRRPRAVFSGLISDRIDLSVLSAVADAGWELVLVGGVQPTFTGHEQFEALAGRPNVRQLGWHSPADVFTIAQWCDAGLLPYTLSDFNLASSPLKTLEYLGAGLPVLSTALPSVFDLRSPDISIVGSAEDVAACLEAMAAVRTDPHAQQRRVQLAIDNSWTSKAQAYLDLIQAG